MIGQYYPVDELEGVSVLHHGSDYSIGNVWYSLKTWNERWQNNYRNQNKKELLGDK